MKQKVIDQSTIRNLCIVAFCSTLAIGCASNNVKPAKSGIEIKPGENITETSLVSPAPDQTEQSVTAVNQVSEPEQEIADESTKFPGIDISSDTQPEKTTFYFGFDKSTLEEPDIDVIKQHAKFMLDNPGLILNINGHTDQYGPQAYNEYLSKKRAEEVASIMIAEGVPESQLVINANGDRKPLQNVSDKRKNRRVELEYSEINLVSY